MIRSSLRSQGGRSNNSLAPPLVWGLSSATLRLPAPHRLQRQILILGRASAVGKVSAFLLDMADRLSVDDRCRVDLPMSRYDIADYLVMSVETVSRSLTALRSHGTIALLGAQTY